MTFSTCADNKMTRVPFQFWWIEYLRRLGSGKLDPRVMDLLFEAVHRLAIRCKQDLRYKAGAAKEAWAHDGRGSENLGSEPHESHMPLAFSC